MKQLHYKANSDDDDDDDEDKIDRHISTSCKDMFRGPGQHHGVLSLGGMWQLQSIDVTSDQYLNI